LDFEPHLVQNASIKADAETQWTPSSATKAEEASGGTKGPFLPKCHIRCQLGKSKELKDQRSKANHPRKKFSLLDIISDNSEGDCQKRSPMEVYASFATKGWKDGNHEEGILSQKCNTSDFFTPPGGSRQENIYSINDTGIQENSHTFSWDGTSQTDGSFMESSPILANTSMMYDTRSRDSNFPNASSDGSLMTTIGNIDWLHDHPVERNCSSFHYMPWHLVEFVSLRAENDCGIKFINEDGLEIKSCRTMSPDLPNFCEIQEDTIPEQFDVASSRAMSGDSQTSPYPEEVSVMPEKLNASMMESHLQTKMEVTLDAMGTTLMNDKRAPMAPSPFNSRSSYDATFHSNCLTASKPLSKKSKSSPLGKTEPVIDGNKNICSPLYYLETEENMKYLEIPQNTDQNNFFEIQDNRINLNIIHSSKNVKISSSVDRDKIVIHGHEESQRSTTLLSEGRSVDSKQKTCNLQVESSHVNNQEDIQLRETQHHIDEVHLELEGAQTKERETQEDHFFHENEHLTMCPKELNIKPKRMEDHKTHGHSEENYLYKRSRMTISLLQ
ncbi:hypothetical protein KI387_036681, partial [Taxus chinensis]